MESHPVGPHGKKPGSEAGGCDAKGLAGGKSRPSRLQAPGVLSA